MEFLLVLFLESDLGQPTISNPLVFVVYLSQRTRHLDHYHTLGDHSWEADSRFPLFQIHKIPEIPGHFTSTSGYGDSSLSIARGHSIFVSLGYQSCSVDKDG